MDSDGGMITGLLVSLYDILFVKKNIEGMFGKMQASVTILYKVFAPLSSKMLN